MQAKAQTEADNRLRNAVAMQIDWQPEVLSRYIAVSAQDGVVTLTGFVHHPSERAAAERAARSVYGVKAVVNYIEVKAAVARTDPEIARDVIASISMDSTVPPSRIKVTVKEGLVTLDGKVDWDFQRLGASGCVGRVIGVRGVINNITVRPGPTASASEVRIRIEDALKRSAKSETRQISVTASDGTVTLSGHVRSWFEREEAERAAWAAPGVSNVVDRIAIMP
jgi:osmotically-inducible protein OsmY